MEKRAKRLTFYLLETKFPSFKSNGENVCVNPFFGGSRAFIPDMEGQMKTMVVANEA